MASDSPERRVIIAILLTSTLLTMLGIAGVLRGAYDLSMAPLAEDLRDLYEPEDEFIEAKLQLLEAQLSNPYRRPMAAADVVVSALVLIGSFMLSWRRSLAQWWIKQAVTAKVVWIAAYSVSLVAHIELSAPGFPIDQPGGTTTDMVLSVILMSTMSGALHLAAAYRATRSDIREFIESTARS